MELISVIVPVYNVEQYLDRCIRSIQRQTYTNLEIILVDDGSPDGCPQLCDQLAAEDPRIKVIHKENCGLGFARNSGLEVATGDYVTFIDSDDWISETHIENLYRALNENQADATIGTYTRVDDSGKKTSRQISFQVGIYDKNAILDKIILPLIGPDTDFLNDVQVNSSCCMNLYRMNVIRDNNLRFISEKYAVAEDFYFNIDYFCHSNRVVAVNETGYFYFENCGSISRKYDPKRFERTLNFYDQIYNQVKEYDLKEKIGYRADRTFLVKIRVAIRHIVISDLQKKQKLQEIKTILSNELTKEVLLRYPIETFIPAMRMLAKMMRSENVIGVYYLMRFRESAKQQKLLKTVLKFIGIGKYKTQTKEKK